MDFIDCSVIVTLKKSEPTQHTWELTATQSRTGNSPH